MRESSQKLKGTKSGRNDLDLNAETEVETELSLAGKSVTSQSSVLSFI